jgi:Leucine-rich repeat (LRR) protein
LVYHTQELSLYGNEIGDAGLTALAKAVESGALAQLTELRLGFNKIGDVGMQALVGAVSNGALPALKELYFDRNKISNTVKATVKEVCKQRGIDGSPDLL